jgi:uncharacterized protein (DUF433 family)
MDWKEHIVIDADILVGKPIIRGTRISVEFILDLLGEGWSEADILSNYPSLKSDDIRAALQYATSVLKEEKVYSIPITK